jgi:FdhD protein
MRAAGSLSGAVRRIDITRVGASRAEPAGDAAAVEEPLHIRVDEEPFAVIMRTPGADRELVAGFLLAERAIAGADDLDLVRHCTTDQDGAAANVIEVTLAPDAAARLRATLGSRRQVTAASACGLCGRRTIDDLMTGVPPVAADWRVSRALIDTLPRCLAAEQDAFAATGGLHAAGLFDTSGRLVSIAEDVGRHNAVDKVIGAELLMDRLPLDRSLLLVSGRAGYEIVQKALVAGIPIVAAVSAPSSLAIDLANEGGVTLLGFVRGTGFNIYAGARRIDVA